MSQPSRPRSRGTAERRRREVKFDVPVPLERRALMAPIVATYPLTVSTSAPATPTNSDVLNVTVLQNTATATLDTMAPITSVSELTPISAFGNQIVTIAPGPGGVFGEDVYAITRGPGDNADLPNTVNNPGVIYRVDPATGQASVFFDLNSVISQIDPGNATPTTPAANGLLTSSGLVNWYSITFDSEGVFSGSPAMFVSSVSRSDPSKNIIFEIAPNGTLMGVFTQMTDGLSSLNFNISPTAILVPPVQDQSFLNGLIGGSGISSVNGTFAALYFQASSYSPGQVISNSNLPTGVSETELGEPVIQLVSNSVGSIVPTSVATGPIVGLTAANTDYTAPIYSIFTDFGTPAAGKIPATPGYSGVQGSTGELLIGGGITPTALTGSGSIDNLALGAVTTPFRRFESVAFDQYGYFSQSIDLTSSSSVVTGGSSIPTYTVPDAEPDFGGSLFVSDLASGLYVTLPASTVTLPGGASVTIPAGFIVPVQGSGQIGITTDASGNVIPIVSTGGDTTGNDLPGSADGGTGGRIIRILPNGTVNTFAYNFDTSNAQDYSSFVNSSLTIGFSADGTTLYASDDQGIWQFKTTASLADSTSGTLVGLNDLRTLGVPYDGQNSAVDVVDTGVDASLPSFRGRVAPGTDIFTGGLGNMDLAASTTSTTTGGTGGSGTTGGTTVLSNTLAGHGTPVAGVIAQFVPQATIDPIDIFLPYIASVTLSSSSSTGGTGGTGGSGSSGSSTSLGGTANALTSTNLLYNGLEYVIQHPFVNDPLRPGKVDRVIAASFAFGTGQTFQSEVDAYKNYPQIVIALKNAYHKFLKEGIAPIAASGEFGAPLGAGSASSSTGGTGGSGGSGSTGGTTSLTGANNADNSSLGDTNGMSLPAVLDEVISVTGVYSFPYDQTPASPPTDRNDGVLPNPLGPILLLGNSLTIGGTASSSTGGTGSTGGATGSTTGFNANAQLLAAADLEIYANRILGSVNRSDATDFAAPALNVPTFKRQVERQTITSSTTTGTGTTVSNPLTFTQAGTSMSEAIVTGAYALVSSALTYWTNLSTSNGYTADAYLNTPVGTDSLNFGKRAFKNLAAWNTPSGINSILQWTAVPATDANDGGSLSTPPTLPGGTSFRSYSVVNVANAVAAIEGYEAIHYLTAHNDWQYIDTNHDKVITAQEITNFVDSAAADGMPEAGAMAALLGGTATYGAVQPGLNNEVFNENPDDPAAEQRRFNFFDYAADGQLNGSVTINEYKMLGRILLPSPNSFAITDRQRSSANGYLLNPTAQRDYVALQHILPTYQWVSAAQVKKYRNVSPAQFGVGLNEAPGTYLPLYTLFDAVSPAASSSSTPAKTVVSASKSANIGGVNVTVDWLSAVPQSPTPTSTTSTGTTGSTTSTSTASGTTTPSASPNIPAGTTTTTTTTTSTTSGTAASSTTSGTSAAQTVITSAQALATAAQDATDDMGVTSTSSATTGGTSGGTSSA